MVMGLALSTGETVEDIEYWPYAIGEVTAEDVQRVAEKYLNPDAIGDYPPVSGYLLPQGQTDNGEAL